MIITSIIAEDQEDLNYKLNKVREFSEIIQLDIMDGEFVENKSLFFDFEVLKEPFFSGKYEAHLMVKHPEEWVREHGHKVDTIIAPIESIKNFNELFELVKSKNKNLALAINPDTNLERLIPYLEKISKILILTVYPGRYGAPFVPETLNKIKELRKLTKIPIEVDGHINPQTLILCKQAGADQFAVGSFIIKADHAREKFEELKILL
jgi:ribulose-phosphate 3-epimerase